MYFTLCKNQMAIVLLAEIVIFSGCAHKTVQTGIPKVADIAPLDQARHSYDQGEYYKARVLVQNELSKDPENTAAQQLMGDVLDKEIARQKEAILVGSADADNDDRDGGSDESNQTEVKNWLERSKSLLHQNQYDLALFAAEKVFVYDANNREASLLIDDIKDKAVKSGKADTLFLSKMYKEEVSERVKNYRSEAKQLLSEDKKEQAKFNLQKILLLEPEDPEALRLFSDLQKKEAHK